MGFLYQVLFSQSKKHLASELLNKWTLIVRRTIKKQHSSPTRLAEVGRLESAKVEGKYETGQLFLHRIFGYRGVVLFPWNARVYDRDVHNFNKQSQTPVTQPTPTPAVKTTPSPTAPSAPIISAAPKEKSNSVQNENVPSKDGNNEDMSSSLKSQLNEVVNTLNAAVSNNNNNKTTTTNTSNEKETADSNQTSSSDSTTTKDNNNNNNNNAKEMKGKVNTFYQVLIDARDCPFIRAQTEAVTFLGTQDSNRSLYAIPGLDYVSHEDIMPYSSIDKHPLQHELFDKFLAHVPDRQPTFEAKDTLKSWQEKNHPWLELSDVHKETTENIRITVIPFYMGCRETQASSVYWWRYSIRLENLGMMSVQLRERHWRIFSLSGTLETVRGRGVVGQEPILSPRLPAFQYSSHVSLQAPSGHMWGTFRLEREDGHMFDCKIPPFSLESKPDEPSPSETRKTE